MEFSLLGSHNFAEYPVTDLGFYKIVFSGLDHGFPVLILYVKL